MAHPYAFLAAGVIGAALAFFIWLKTENNRQQVPARRRCNPQSSSNNDFLPRNFDSETNCIICIERQGSILFLPCQHCCLCPDCTKQYVKQSSKCPLCRAEIVEIMSL